MAGTLYCFTLRALIFPTGLIPDRSWDLENPITVCLSKLAVMDLTEARGKLWCASGNYIHVLDIETLGTEVFFILFSPLPLLVPEISLFK